MNKKQNFDEILLEARELRSEWLPILEAFRQESRYLDELHFGSIKQQIELYKTLLTISIPAFIAALTFDGIPFNREPLLISLSIVIGVSILFWQKLLKRRNEFVEVSREQSKSRNKNLIAITNLHNSLVSNTSSKLDALEKKEVKK